MTYPLCEVLSPEALLSSLTPEEILIVLPSEDNDTSEMSKSLRKASWPQLYHQSQGLQQHLGLWQAKSPFAYYSFETGERDSFERRWLMRKALQRLRSVFPGTKLVVYLSGRGSALQSVLADDIYSYCCDETTGPASCCTLRMTSQTSPPERDHLRRQHLQCYRRWINEEPDQLTSLEIAARLTDFAEANGCQARILDTSALREEGMNLLLAVGQASKRSPSRLIIIEKNTASGQKPLVLMGKGITFDTGGINVKAFESYVNCMKNDMGGAALMSQLFMNLVVAGYSGPLALVIPTCENLVAELAMKPGAIIKSHSGKRVFIEHTDAEGRLILADALSYTNKHLNPQQIIVGATLTTAALRQFSGYMTPIYFSSQDFQQRLRSQGQAWGEKFVFFDSFLPFAQPNQTQCADLTNMGRLPAQANIGGASFIAAQFLREFSQVAMTHIDIFASCWNWSGDYPGNGYGATGAPYNSLLATLMPD